MSAIKKVHLSSYVTAQAVRDHMSSNNGLNQAVSLLRKFGIEKVYLEVYRGGLQIDVDMLAAARDYLRANSIEVAGGIATVAGGDFGVGQNNEPKWWFNWQAQKTQQDLERIIRQAAPLFDEFIVDDFLCTSDTSPESEAARGERTWGEYRRDLLSQVSERLVCAAHEENPKIRVIIKYPQWYDRFHLFGYDVVREPQIFDGVWVGTETRGPDTRYMGFVKQYEGFVNYRWLTSLAGDKVGGAWFDHIDCEPQDYLDQAYQTVLAGATKIILFNYYDLVNDLPGYHLLKEHAPKLSELARWVNQHPASGVYGYKPPHSDAGGDLYIFDYIGMMGIPLVPCSTFPMDAKVAFLPTQAAMDPGITACVEEFINSDRTLIVTSGFLHACGMKLVSLAGLKRVKPAHNLKADQLLVGNKVVRLAKDLDLEAKIEVENAHVILSAQVDGESVPFLTCYERTSPRSTKSKIYVLNSHTFSEEDFLELEEALLAPRDLGLLDLPEEWLTEVRRSFIEPLGIDFQAPSRTALYLLGNGNYVIANFNNRAISAKLAVHGGSITCLTDVYTGQKIMPSGRTFTIEIPKRGIRWIQCSV